MLRTVAASLAIAALSAVSLPAQESALAVADQEMSAAKAAILQGLSRRDRDYAVAMAKLNGPPILNLRGMKLFKGQIGQLGESVDEHSDGRRPLADNDARLVVDKIIDEDEVLIADQQLWLEGVDASTFVEGRLPQLGSVVFEVQGQRHYNSPPKATRRVWHLKALDVATAMDAAAKIRALKDYRLWRSDSGELLRHAKYISFRRGRVTLEYLDGKSASLPLPRLSKADQDFVRQTVKNATAK